MCCTERSMYAPQVLINPVDRCYQSSGRLWQGIPSVEITKEGTVFVCFYSGMQGEESGNFVVLIRGKAGLPEGAWEDPFLVIHHPDPAVRCFDPCLWIDPQSRLWLFWAQSDGLYDGRAGTWCIRCDAPDANTMQWTEPVRIGHGVMMNKPTVTSTGQWLLPIGLWGCEAAQKAGMKDQVGSNVYVSQDQGGSFFLRGSPKDWRYINEHMVVELADQRLWMLIRAENGIDEAFSKDGGITWTPAQKSRIGGPSSRFFIRRLKSGRLLMVNHVNFQYDADPSRGSIPRNNLVAQLSEDDGRNWIGALVLDTRQNISYPDGMEDENGLIHVVYDRERYKDREILMCAFREEDILSGGIVSPDAHLRQVICKAAGTVNHSEIKE